MSNSSRKKRKLRVQHRYVTVDLVSQGNGLSREIQVSLGTKIEVMIEEELRFFMNTKYQASPQGKVAIMIITSSDLAHIGKIKSYIIKNFQMTANKITGHGNIAGTLKYNLSEIRTSSVEKIEEHYALLFPDGHKKVDGKQPHLVLEKVILAPAEKTQTQTQQKQKIMKAESRTLGLSKFLHAYLCSDRKINHPSFDSKECHLSHFLTYKRDLIGSSDALNCANEAIAQKVEVAIEWILGSKFVAREGSQVLVDLSEWKNREKRLGSVNFTLPPNQNASTDEVLKRLVRANITSKPTSVRKEENVFLVTYHWKTTGAMVFDIISEMGWKAGLDGHGNLLVYVNDLPKSEELLEDTETSQSSEEIPQVVEEEAHSSSSVVHDVSTEPEKVSAEKPEVVTSPLSHLIYEKKDAFNELRKLYDNPKLLSMLPKQMQIEVARALKDNFMEENPLDYATYLLSILKK